MNIAGYYINMIQHSGVSYPWLCNMGSPMTRQASEKLTGSLLGESDNDGSAKLSRFMTAGIKFKADEDPVETTYEILKRAGFDDPEDLKNIVPFPDEPMVCVPSDSVIPIIRRGRVKVDVPFLTAALVLGLCTATFYDPSRPIVWTQKSLTRKVRLFTVGGFYASA